MVENIFCGGESARAAHHRHALPYAGRTLAGGGRCGEIEVDVVGDHQVEVAVTIVVNPCTSCTPCFSGSSYARFLRYFNEGAMLVMKQSVLAVIRDVEIFPSVVVIVTHANALSPTRCSQARLNGYVCERTVVVVVVEMIGGSLVRGKAFQCGAVHEKNIGPAIIVIIKNSHAAAGGFDNVLFRVFAAEDSWHRQTGRLGHIGVVGDGIVRGFALCLSRYPQPRESHPDQRAE